MSFKINSLVTVRKISKNKGYWNSGPLVEIECFGATFSPVKNGGFQQERAVNDLSHANHRTIL